jgi:hypothetical protein
LATHAAPGTVAVRDADALPGRAHHPICAISSIGFDDIHGPVSAATPPPPPAVTIPMHGRGQRRDDRWPDQPQPTAAPGGSSLVTVRNPPTSSLAITRRVEVAGLHRPVQLLDRLVGGDGGVARDRDHVQGVVLLLGPHLPRTKRPAAPPWVREDAREVLGDPAAVARTAQQQAASAADGHAHDSADRQLEQRFGRVSGRRLDPPPTPPPPPLHQPREVRQMAAEETATALPRLLTLDETATYLRTPVATLQSPRRSTTPLCGHLRPTANAQVRRHIRQ